MTDTELEKLKYPIGKFTKPAKLTSELLNSYTLVIERFPQRLKTEVADLTNEQLDTEYRPDGWTIRQVVHHCADSHMNSFIRFKLALTEDKPIIKPYLGDRWAELTDTKTMPIEPSLSLLTGLHARWTVLLRSLSGKDLSRGFVHPEHGREFQLDENIGLYAWHCNHHLVHITTLIKTKGWK